MAYTDLNDDLAVTKWARGHLKEYVRMTGYKPYMSTSENAIIHVNRDLIDGGKDIVIALIGSLRGNGVGSGLLTGAEEKLSNYPFRTRPVWRRNAVVVKKSTLQKTQLELLEANRTSLKIWSSDDMRERIND